jgi:hypothetical protein
MVEPIAFIRPRRWSEITSWVPPPQELGPEGSSPDASVGQFRPGSAGRWPPRLSRASAMRASGDLNPKAILVIRRILVLVDSIRPFDLTVNCTPLR